MKYREIIPLKQSPNWSVTLPGSKSITNRAFLCASLAIGKSRIFGALESDDTKVMLDALRKLEIRIIATRARKAKSENAIIIEGNGGKFKSGKVILNAGASGTATRFLTALSVLREGKTIIKGTKRMGERPIEDLTDALDQLKNGRKVIKLRGGKSSQFLSALLMISPLIAPLKIEVIGKLVSKPYIDVTLDVMKKFGIKIRNNDYRSFSVNPQIYRATDFYTEGDASAAGYWTSIAYLHDGKVRFANLTEHSNQGDARYYDVLKSCRVMRSACSVDMESMPDTAMTLAVTAPFFHGPTKITGLSTLRAKETDRLAALEKELKKIGARVKTTKDSITIEGLRTQDSGFSRNQLCPESCVLSSVKTYNDHRMAMCFAVLGTKIPGIAIEDPDCVSKTYPDFWKDLELAYLSPIKLGQKNLVLTGMRCSGKTRLGKKIARILRRKFIDLDDKIEKSEKMKIADIVSRYGWPYFRKVEQKMCSLFAGQKNLVIATGGGVVLSEKNMKSMRKNGINVFVFADPSVLAERIKRQFKNRPALTAKGGVDEVHDIWRGRRDLYLKYADVVWDNTSGKIVEKNLGQIFV